MSLTFRERPAAQDPAGLLILHHGRGADEQDLLGLADVLDPQRRLHVVTPRAPLTIPGWPGYHWYAVPRVGYPDPDTFGSAHRELAAFHDETWARTGIAPDRTVLGGFSMGSVMSYALGLDGERPAPGRAAHLLRVHPHRRGLAARPATRRARLPVFIAHGRRDPIMDVAFARRAHELLGGGGLPVEYHESDAAHHIDPGPHPRRDPLAGRRRRRQRRQAQPDRGPHRTMTVMRKIQSQGVHHITLVGADRQTSIDFWEGVLGMPFVFEQPNLDNAAESHLYFDPGDGRLITVFTNEERTPDPARTPTDPGCVHHLAFALSQATFAQAVERLDERGIRHSGIKDRGFMDSIYFTDPLGLLIELASYRFEPPAGHTHADVLLAAHRIRVQRGDYNIAPIHLADAIEQLVTASRDSLSGDRAPKDPYTHARPAQAHTPDE